MLLDKSDLARAHELQNEVFAKMEHYIADLKLALATKEAELAQAEKRLHSAEAKVAGLTTAREKWMHEACEARAQIPYLLGCRAYRPLVVPASWNLTWEDEPEGTKRADWLVTPNLEVAALAARVWVDGQWVVYGENGVHLLSGVHRAENEGVPTDGWAAMLRVEGILAGCWRGTINRIFA